MSLVYSYYVRVCLRMCTWYTGFRAWWTKSVISRILTSKSTLHDIIISVMKRVRLPTIVVPHPPTVLWFSIDGEASSTRMPRWPSLDVVYEQSETVYIDARANFQSLWGAGAGAGVGVGAGDDGACGEDGCPCCF